ncbi:hypothetical protein BACCAP_03339 [Pseudoflavonifractor capillosus ATCC 29799]|uniref:Uncharacterized protein n=1 Tax=Pseudoflavonifractor capillosus ATCC 29799 TaxID=411467 RepID=A6NYN7_9FIRM|nr:hypothetical protein BACCAP_03339 [Pseudoflavonifractor capillosus ATCC 29799]
MSCGLFAGKYECEPPPLLTNENSRPDRNGCITKF